MPRQPSAPAHVRTFARVRTFDCECPACGENIKARERPPKGTDKGAQAQQRERLEHRGSQAHAYNTVTSVLRCPHCRAVFMVGLLLWPFRRGGHGGFGMPEDMKPDKRQRAAIRSYAGGFYAEQVKQRGEAVNVFVAGDCTCPMVTGGWSPGCPIHGMARGTEDGREGASSDE